MKVEGDGDEKMQVYVDDKIDKIDEIDKTKTTKTKVGAKRSAVAIAVVATGAADTIVAAKTFASAAAARMRREGEEILGKE
jgi:hypothetical protein